MLNGFHHVALKCADLDKSIAFYTAIGGEVAFTWGEGDSRACMISIGKGNCLELFANGTPGEKPENAVAHFAIQSLDTEADFAKALAAGATMVSAAQKVLIPSKPYELPVKLAFCKGPDGEVIEFFQI